MFYVLLLAIAVLAEDSLGLRIGVQGVRRQTASLPRREFDPTAPLRNSGDISYYASIVLGQQFFSVLVDTGRYGSSYAQKIVLIALQFRSLGMR